MPEDKNTVGQINQLTESVGLDAVLEPKQKKLDDSGYIESMKKLKENEETLLELTERIDQLSEIFKFPLGCKVRNRHNEDGYIEICGVDLRGPIYLVNFPGGINQWYSEFEIHKIQFDPDNVKAKKKDDPRIKTDIPE